MNVPEVKMYIIGTAVRYVFAEMHITFQPSGSFLQPDACFEHYRRRPIGSAPTAATEPQISDTAGHPDDECWLLRGKGVCHGR